MNQHHLLLVDDSAVMLKKMAKLLQKIGYRITALQSPVQALKWLRIPGNRPDLIIVDVSMPEMSGYDLTTLIRSDPSLAYIPIMMLTGHTDLDEKVSGYEAGVDDYLSKEIDPKELEVRISALLTRSKLFSVSQSQPEATVVTVFSLRGGAGTTTVAVNLAVALAQRRTSPVSLVDLALHSSHCALMLNMKPRGTLANVAAWQANMVDLEIIEQLMLKHQTGVRLLPGPQSMVDNELITVEVIDRIWPYLHASYPFLVVDGGSRLTEPALTILERSHVIILLLAPELASLKSAVDTLRTLDQLNFDLRRVQPVMNWTFPSHGLAQKELEHVLGHQISAVIPYDSTACIQAINAGRPVVLAQPKTAISQAIQKLAAGVNDLSHDRQPSMTLVPRPKAQKPGSKGNRLLRPTMAS